jgi:hypothetical protein
MSSEEKPRVKGSGETIDPMRPSKRLIEMLASKKLNRSKLSRLMGVTPPSVARWLVQLDKGEIDDDVWRRLAQVLRPHGIDVSEIREVAPPAMAGGLRTDMLPLLDRFHRRDQLEALQAILFDAESHGTILLVVAERLRKM